MSVITIRMDDELKSEMTETLESMGLNVTTFFTMAAKQLVARQELPFEVKAGKPQPNYMSEELEKILITERAKMLNIIPDDATLPPVNYSELKEQYKNGEL